MSAKGTSNKPSSDISTSDVDTVPPPFQTIQSSSTSSTSQTTKSTQVQTPILSSPIQTSTPSIVSFPETVLPFNQQSDSKATLSNQSSESLFQDPPSPPTEHLSKLRIPTSAPVSTLSPVLNSIHSDTPMSESVSVNIPISEPINSEIPVSEPVTFSPLTSETATPQPIPLAHLDASGNEVIIILVVTLPSETSSSSEIILHQPIPNNIEECINLFGYDALKRIHELSTSACPHPVLVKRAWEEFRRWLDQSFQNIAQMAESTRKTEVLAAAERRIQYELELAA